MGTQTVYLKSGISPTGTSKTNIFQMEEAVNQCCVRMLEALQPHGVSGGVSFGLDEEADSPKSGWRLWLHRGPLPLLEIELPDRTGFKPPPEWRKSLISSGAAHVICTGGNGYLGSADHLYLLLKRQKLFPYSKGDSGEGAVAAGQHLRLLCGEIWSKQGGEKAGPHKLSSWRWSQKRFVRKFDKMLVTQTGSQELIGILKAMGTDLDQWFQACE